MEYRVGMFPDDRKGDDLDYFWSLKLTDEKQNADGVLRGVTGLNPTQMDMIRRSEIWCGYLGYDEEDPLPREIPFDYGWDPDTRRVWIFDTENDPNFETVGSCRWGDLPQIMRVVATHIENEYWENRP